MRRIVSLCSLLVLSPVMFAQNFDPPPPKKPDAATLARIEEQKKLLDYYMIAIPDIYQADLEIYRKAVEWITRHEEYFTADSGKQTLAVIEQGINRAKQAVTGKPSWLDAPGKSVARGYLSYDFSVQPYAVWYPAGYGSTPKKYRIEIMLHGRDSTLTEVKFLNAHAGKTTPKDQDYIQIDIYGRGNNAYRWAGEEDISRVLVHFLLTEGKLGREKYLNAQRVLKGFSMGGAGTWHIGLRHPSWFVALQPGAGFTTTHGYIGGLPNPLPAPQEELLTIYDAINYAPNAANVPIVAYSGEIDKQRKAAENIEKALEKLGLTKQMTHLIAPGLAHQFPPAWQRKAEEKVREFTGDGRDPADMPALVDFTTYTLKTSGCNWITIEGMNRHYQAARVQGTWDGKTFDVRTSNVRRLKLSQDDPARPGFPNEVILDGVKTSCVIAEDKPTRSRTFAKLKDKWVVETAPPTGLEKCPDLQGPIDDAFTKGFVCVVGTGKPLNSKMHEAAIAQLERFEREWDKNFRGKIKIIKDSELKQDEIDERSLILFGDPGSNSVIARFLPDLQMQWTSEKVSISGTVHDAKTHLPMLVRPSPGTKQKRYVVINSGHTFHQADFNGTNALLYPRLGDYAIVKPTPREKEKAAFEVIENGLFDEFWKVRR